MRVPTDTQLPADDSPGARGRRSLPAVPGGYRVVLLAIAASALTGPGQTTGISVFIDHFVEDLSLSLPEVSFAYLIGTLTGALLLPSVGRFIDLRGVRRSQIIVGLLFGLALVNMSLVNGFVWLAIGFTGIRFLGQGSLSLISTVTVSIWYRRRRGTVLGVFSTVTSALNSLIPVGLAVIIAGVGWRNAWLVAAGIVVGIVVPMAYFGLRQMPLSSSESVVEVDGEGAEIVSIDRPTAVRTRAFWVLAAAAASTSMMTTALNFHQVDLLGDIDYTPVQAAAVFIPQVLGSTITGFAVGWASDRVGTRYLPAGCMGLLVATHLLAAALVPGIVVILYAVTLGAVGAGVRTASSSLLPEWFGTGHLGAIQGALTFFTVSASALGPLTLAVTEDAFGSYPPAILLLATVPAAAMIFGLLPMPIPTKSPVVVSDSDG